MAIARVGASGQSIPTGGISDILEGGRGYLGPGRLIPPAIGGGSALGLKTLWSKITGEEGEEKEKEFDQGIEIDTETRRPRKVNPKKWLESEGKNPDDYTEEELDEIANDLWDLQEDSSTREREYLDRKVKGETSSLEDKLYEIRKRKEETGRMIETDDLIRWQEIKDIQDRSYNKIMFPEKARGGLIGINELTRGL